MTQIIISMHRSFQSKLLSIVCHTIKQQNAGMRMILIFKRHENIFFSCAKHDWKAFICSRSDPPQNESYRWPVCHSELHDLREVWKDLITFAKFECKRKIPSPIYGKPEIKWHFSISVISIVWYAEAWLPAPLVAFH